MNGLRPFHIRRLLPENVKSPSKIFANLGKQVAIGFKIGLMRGSIMVIEKSRSKYKLVNRIIIPDYLPFGPDRLKEIKEYYE